MNVDADLQLVDGWPRVVHNAHQALYEVGSFDRVLHPELGRQLVAVLAHHWTHLSTGSGNTTSGGDLAERWLVAQQERYDRALPRATCLCGRRYAIQPVWWKRTYMLPDDWTPTKEDRFGWRNQLPQLERDACPCGRDLADIGKPEQLTLGAAFA